MLVSTPLGMLRCLNARADAYVNIPQALEVSLIIAITYDLLSLFKLLYGGLHIMGLEFTAREAIMWIAPRVLLALLVIVMRIRQAKHAKFLN